MSNDTRQSVLNIMICNCGIVSLRVLELRNDLVVLPQIIFQAPSLNLLLNDSGSRTRKSNAGLDLLEMFDRGLQQ
jgi:hypothetical protein